MPKRSTGGTERWAPGGAVGGDRRRRRGTSPSAWRWGPAALVVLVATILPAAPALAQLTGGLSYPINGAEAPPVSFGTMGDAVAYLAMNGVAGTGEVILELSPGYVGEVAPVFISAIPGVSASLGVTFRPASGYTATSIVPATSSARYAIRINVSYVTLDGRAGGVGAGHDWTIRCAKPFTGSAVAINQTSGAKSNISVHHCVLESEGEGGAIVDIDPDTFVALTNVVIEDNIIRNVGTTAESSSFGINIHDGGTSNTNTGFVVRSNVITQFYSAGISISNAQIPGAVIEGNEISHTSDVTPPNSVEFNGIYFSGSAIEGRIVGNFIHDIRLTGAGGSSVNGIRIRTSGPLHVHNNRIAIGEGLRFDDKDVYGVVIDGSADVNVYYNTVLIGGSPSTDNETSAAFRKSVNGALDLRNNIFFNSRSNAGTGSGTHWAISLNSMTGVNSINDNVYYATGNGGVLGTTDGTASGNATTLAAWKAAVPADTNSMSRNPRFVDPAGSPPDLHLDPSVASRLESGGTAVSGIDEDFDGDIRQGSAGYAGGGTAPDIGADELEGTPAFPNDIEALAFVAPAHGQPFALGQVFAPEAVFDNSGLLDQVDVTVRFRIVGPLPSTTEVYNDVVVLPLMGRDDGAQSIAFAATSLAAAGRYTMYATAEMAGDQNSGNDEVSGEIAALLPLAGTYDVGASEAVPFNTLSGAVAALNQVGISASVAFRLSDLSYAAPEESFPLTIAAVVGAGSAATITIKPAGPGTSITGNAQAVFVLDGADHVTIDGSSAESPRPGKDSRRSGGRDLTIENVNLGPGTAVVWIKSVGVGAGAMENTIENCVLVGGVDQRSSTAATYGVIASGSSIATTSAAGGEDNDNNRIQNNEIRRVRWGVFLNGRTANLNDGNVVNENLIGPGEFGPDQIGVGGIVLARQNQAEVRLNEVRFVGGLVDDSAITEDRVGIGLGDDGWIPSSTPITASRVEQNRIHHIVQEKTWSAVGIIVAGSGASTANRIANNMIYEVRANGVGGNQAVGIGVGGGDGDVIVFNSVSMAGDLDPGTSTTATHPAAGIRIWTNSVTNLMFKNNIVSLDLNSNATVLKHFAIVAPPAFSWGAGGSDNNDYSVAGGNPQVVLGGIGYNIPFTEVPTLAEWRLQFTPNQDASSIDLEPRFVSMTDLHIDTSGKVTSPLADAGIAIAGVVDDFDGENRAVSPDMGADEFSTYALNVSVVGDGAVLRDPDFSSYNPLVTVQLTAVPNAGESFIEWSGDISGNTNPVDLVMDSDKNITATFTATGGLTIEDVTLAEGDTGTTEFTFVVNLTSAQADTIRVSYATADSTAQESSADYSAISGQLVLPPGAITDTVTVHVTGDLLNEADEVFKLILSDPQGAALLDGTGLGMIQNDDPLPTLTIDDMILAEGNVDTTEFVFTVTRSALSGQTVSVDVSTADSTAQSGSDYRAVPITMLSFPPADTSLTRTVVVCVFGDTIPEADEVFQLLLTGVANAVIADGVGLGTIEDDDAVVGVDEVIPAVTFLSASRPNPFHEQVHFTIGLNAPGTLRLQAFDVGGRLVRSLLNEEAPAGILSVVWDGRDDAGRRLGAGVYFVRMEGTRKTFTRRVVLAR